MDDIDARLAAYERRAYERQQAAIFGVVRIDPRRFAEGLANARAMRLRYDPARRVWVAPVPVPHGVRSQMGWL